MELSDRELATVLAALRYWQQSMDGSTAWAKHVMPEHFYDVKPLTSGEIGALCERING